MKIPITRVVANAWTLELLGSKEFIVDCHPERKTITFLTSDGKSREECFDDLNREIKGTRIFFGHISDEELDQLRNSNDQ